MVMSLWPRFFSPTLYSYPKDSDVINTSTYNDSLQAAIVFRPPHLSIADVLWFG